MTKTAAYDADALEEPAEAGSGGWLREVTVHVSMMIVIAALGMALRTSFGFGMVPAIVSALAVYWCLLVVHALVRRGQAAADLSAEVAHLADENAALRRLVGAPRHPVGEREPPRLAGLTAERPPPRALDRAKPPETARPRVPEPLKVEPPKAGPAPRAGESAVRDPAKAKAPTAPAPVAPKSAAASPTRHAAMARDGHEDGVTSKPGPAASGTRAGPPRPPPPSARPRPQGLAALAVEKPAAKPPIEAPRETPEAGDPRAQDIAIMQSLIKGLADQINGPMIKAEAARAPVAPAPSPAASAPTLDTVEEQVDALRGMADDMRDSLIAPGAGAAAASGVLGVHEELARAIEASRIDVCLDPILRLDDRRARHFEVSVRLRSDSGEMLDPRALAVSIAGTGLTPRIEALTFTETIRLAGEFAARGAAADLFSIASGESLRDRGFNAALSGALAPDAALGTRLVMSIAQAEVRAFGPAHWAALAALSEAGLRYALVDVVDLDMDFEALAGRGFEFVRLDAQVFLQGLPAPHGFVPAADLCRHLSGLGFTLIVSRIAEERELVKVLGFGALLGQGRLFGGPRPIRRDRAAHRPSAA
ncbi:MAG: EAL domain-containing protein [Hyphomicrobiaceae bacterium]